MTTPQEEAEQRWPNILVPSYGAETAVAAMRDYLREGFVAGAEWQAKRLGPLVEAARLVVRADPGYWTDIENEADADEREALYFEALNDLRAAVTALYGEGENDG